MHQISCTKSPCTKSLMPQISYASDFSLCTKFLRICTKSLIVPQISHASNLPCTKSLIVPQISVHQISHAPNCMHQIGFTKSDSPNFPAPNRIERHLTSFTTVISFRIFCSLNLTFHIQNKRNSNLTRCVKIRNNTCVLQPI